MITPSPEQLAIFSHVRLRQGNLLISACAGGGKTTTLRLCLDHIPRTPGHIIPPAVRFLSFGKEIVTALEKVVPSWCRCQTFNAFGLGVLKSRFPKLEVRFDKVAKLVYRLCDRDDPDLPLILRGVSLLKSCWPVLSEAEVGPFLEDFLDFASPASAGKCFRAFTQSCEDTKTVDFDDMQLLPLLHDAKFPALDYVLVDEAQDTNDVQLEMLARCARPKVQGPDYCAHCDSEWFDTEECPNCGDPNNERRSSESVSPTTYLFVGDPHQAIYAFRGANADSIQKIVARFACTELPLSVSYRCPQLHVLEAQKYI